MVPVYGMSWLATGIIAHFYVALEELHCNMIIVTIVQQDTIVLICRNLYAEHFWIGGLTSLCVRKAELD